MTANKTLLPTFAIIVIFSSALKAESWYRPAQDQLYLKDFDCSGYSAWDCIDVHAGNSNFLEEAKNCSIKNSLVQEYCSNAYKETNEFKRDGKIRTCNKEKNELVRRCGLGMHKEIYTQDHLISKVKNLLHPTSVSSRQNKTKATQTSPTQQSNVGRGSQQNGPYFCGFIAELNRNQVGTNMNFYGASYWWHLSKRSSEEACTVAKNQIQLSTKYTGIKHLEGPLRCSGEGWFAVAMSGGPQGETSFTDPQIIGMACGAKSRTEAERIALRECASKSGKGCAVSHTAKNNGICGNNRGKGYARTYGDYTDPNWSTSCGTDAKHYLFGGY